MKMKTRLFLFLTLVLAFASCKKDKTIGFDLGKNRFTTVVDGDDREYYVHVPESYDPDVPIPVVYMLHGTSGDGLKFYNISGWKELGESENILTVFPSSWRYCVIEDGNTQNITKWNCYPGAFSFCNGEAPRDDVKFLRQILTDLGEKFTLDECSRLYGRLLQRGPNGYTLLRRNERCHCGCRGIIGIIFK
jgi:poly(3-hydroxybutyrate) depolymerase